MESNKEILFNQTSSNSSNSFNDSNPNINDNLKFIDYSRFEKINELKLNLNDLGIELFKAYWKDTNSIVILKKFHFQYLEKIKSFYNLCYHQNILPAFGFTNIKDTEDYFLITEYPNGGILRNYLRENHQKLSWNDKMRLAIDFASGLQCIHSYDIAHLNLHPYNIFIHDNRLLIGDIALSKSDVSIPENLKILPYFEPDSSLPRDKSSDIFSLGFLLYELSSGEPPFASIRHNPDLSKKLLSGQRGKPIMGTPIEYIDLYEQCWDNDPIMRPNIENVLSRLSKMNLSSIYEDNTMNGKKKGKKNEVEVISEASTQNRLESVVLDFGGGVDSGFGSESRERRQVPTEKKGKKCQLLPCLPKCRITFGVFLCWMCVILVIACVFLGYFLTKLVKKN